jgi:hypothetical protein
MLIDIGFPKFGALFSDRQVNTFRKYQLPKPSMYKMNRAGALQMFVFVYQKIYAIRSLLSPHEVPSSLTDCYFQKYHAVGSEDTVLRSTNTERSSVLRIK